MSELRILVKILICSPHSPLAHMTHVCYCTLRYATALFPPGNFASPSAKPSSRDRSSGRLETSAPVCCGCQKRCGAVRKEPGQKDRALPAELDPLSSSGMLSHHPSQTFHRRSVTILHFLDCSSGLKHPGCHTATSQVKVQYELYVYRKT